MMMMMIIIMRMMRKYDNLITYQLADFPSTKLDYGKILRTSE